MEQDLVCGVEIDPEQATARTDFEGRTYYFCSQDCYQEFMQSPEQYAELSDELGI